MEKFSKVLPEFFLILILDFTILFFPPIQSIFKHSYPIPIIFKQVYFIKSTDFISILY